MKTLKLSFGFGSTHASDLIISPFQVMMVMGKRQEKLELGDDGNWCKLNVQIEECNEVIRR